MRPRSVLHVALAGPVAALAGLLAGACGDNVRAVASGTRLEAIVDVAGPGAEALAYFRDRALGIECVFAPGADDVWRCLPRHSAAIAGYADAACQVPIVECHDCGDARVAVIREPGCVVPIARPVQLADTAAPAFVRTALGCVSATFPPGTYLAATDDDPARFVAGTFDDRELTFDFGVRWLVADDGAHQLHHGYRRRDHATCTFAGTSTTPRCLPGTPAQTELGLAYFYAEDSCSSRIALSSPRPGCEPTTHARIDGAVHALTALAGPAFERSAVDSRCFPTLETALAFWAIGPVDDTLPAAQLYALGDAPVRPVYYAADGQPMEFARRWVDVDERTCFAHPTRDAGRRCIPRSQTLTTAGRRFSEPTCTQELVDNPDSLLYAIAWEGIDDARDVTEDSVVAEVRPLRSYPGTDVYAFVDGTCARLPESAVFLAYVGLALDVRRFPSIDRRPAD